MQRAQRVSLVEEQKRVVSRRQDRWHVVAVPLVLGMIDDANGPVAALAEELFLAGQPVEQQELVFSTGLMHHIFPASLATWRNLHALHRRLPLLGGDHTPAMRPKADQHHPLVVMPL